MSVDSKFMISETPTSVDEEQYNFNTLSGRLSYALRVCNMSQAELARRVGIKQQSVQYLCSNKAEKSKYSDSFAKALEISSTWLLTGRGHMNNENDPSYRFIHSKTPLPILSEEEIISIHVNHSGAQSDYENQVFVDVAIAKNAFAMYLKDQSMYPKFEKNSLLVISTDFNDNDNNDYVLAYIKEFNVIVFRELKIEGDDKYLTPMNQIVYKSLLLSKEDIVLGRLKEIRTYY